MVKPKKPRYSVQVAEPSMDVLYYNQMLDVLRRQQDIGVAFYGNFVYDTKPVPSDAYTQWFAPLVSNPLQNSKSGSEAKKMGPVRRSGAIYTEPGSSMGGQRLGSLTSGSDGGYSSANHRADDFPAGKRAVAFINQYRSKYGGKSEEWRLVMFEQMKHDAARQMSQVEEKGGVFSDEEDSMILVARFVHGNKWSLVEKVLPGRSAATIKKHWHSTLRERYRRYPWCTQYLAPPKDKELNAEGDTTPGKEGDGQVATTTWWKPGADPRLEDDNEDEQALLQADAAELAEAQASGDPSRYSRVLHWQYVRQLGPCESSCGVKGVWEDVCFRCKSAETSEPLMLCQWGRNGVGGPQGPLFPCHKACHEKCMPTNMIQLPAAQWFCARHKCAAAGCQFAPTHLCRSCPNSYCLSHLPQNSRTAEAAYQALPPGQPTFQKIVCRNCLDLELGMVTPVKGILDQSDSGLGGMRRLQSSQRRGRTSPMDDTWSNGEPAWMRTLESIRPLPTNNGGPFVDRIKKAIELLRYEESMKDVKEMLENCISLKVYKSNSAGATKNMALSALDLARRRLGSMADVPKTL